MKLRKGFVVSPIADEYVLVPTGPATKEFHGLMRLNETAGFIVLQLQQDTSSSAIVDVMLEEYEVERQVAEKHVAEIIAKLRSINAIED